MDLKGDILVRIPGYQNVKEVKGVKYREVRTSKVNEVHEDEFKNELEDCINNKTPKEKPKIGAQKEPNNSSNDRQKRSKKKHKYGDHHSSWA